MTSDELYLTGLRIKWDEIDKNSYLRGIEALKLIDEMSFCSPVTIFAGENGSGKSTLLEAIAVSYGFNPEGGSRNYDFSTFDSHSELCDAIVLIKSYKRAKWGYFFRAESFYNVATAENVYSHMKGGVPQRYHEKSHGESFLALFRNNFSAGGLYLLDEPEAALSPQMQLALLSKIVRCAKENSQFFIATHSPILLGIPGAEILSFDSGGIRPVSYSETQGVKITKMFVNDRERVLKYLLEK